MDLVVVGSVAYDTVETPLGKAERKLGGSATYFSAAASHFTNVGVVAAVGTDFADQDRALFNSWDVDTTGLETVDGETFRWSALYEDDLNAITRQTDLGVFAEFDPRLGENHAGAPFLFLANIQPELQLNVLSQMNTRPRLVACDTMNLWIETRRETLTELMRNVDAMLINEGEVRLYTGKQSIVVGARDLIELGPRTMMVKKGEYGVAIFDRSFVFALPAYPLVPVVDPTGAGDSFAGGFMGYLAATGKTDEDALRCAAVVGSVTASFAVESFGPDRLSSVTEEEITMRFEEFINLTRFDTLHEGRELPLRHRNI